MLTKVLPHELDSEMIGYFDRAVTTDEHSGGTEMVSQAIYDGHLECWTWETEGSRMVIITQIKGFPDEEKELLVSMLAGTGGISEWEACTTAFADEVALDRYCNRVVAYVKPSLWKKFKEAGADTGTEELYVVIGKNPTPE